MLLSVLALARSRRVTRGVPQNVLVGLVGVLRACVAFLARVVVASVFHLGGLRAHQC